MGVETVGMVVALGVIVVSGISALPWTDRELRGSVRAFGTLAAVPWMCWRSATSRQVARATHG